jgi:predicted P-loop ATPase
VIQVAPLNPVMLEAALAYAKSGWHVFPLHSVRDRRCSCGKLECGNQGKHPRVMHGFKEATTDTEKIREWWGQWPDANIGVACGDSRLVVVDIDPRNNGDEGFFELEKQYGALPKTRTSLTGGGGQHLVYHVPVGTQPPRSWNPAHPVMGVEIKADGGYIVAPPSTHVLGTYRWDVGQPEWPEEAPEWLCTVQQKKKSLLATGSAREGILGAAFVAAGMAGRTLGKNQMTVECPWADEHTGGGDYDTSTVVFGPAPGSNFGHFHCSHSHCQARETGPDGKKIALELRRKMWLEKLPPDAVAASRASVKGAEREVAFVLRSPWENSLDWNASGTALKANIGNLALLLENLPEWAGVFKHDESHDRLYWAEVPPPVMGLRCPSKGDAIQDYDYIYISQWFALHQNYRSTFKKEQIRDAVMARGWANRHNSLTAHLDSLEWDGVMRVDTWLSEFLGVDDTPYARFVGRAWLISAMARAYRPGCKADHVLVLEGRQGVGKTSTFEIIGGEWHLPDIPRVDNKDARGVISTAWIAEFSELAALKGVEQQKVKSFITERVDKYRPPYGHNFVTKPRRCVFAGSTNECEWIMDSTGGRRFWPVRVIRVNFKRLEDERGALLAEARNLYREGELWYPKYDGEIESMIREQQSSRVETDPWDKLVADYIGAKLTYDRDYQPTLGECFHAVGVQIDKQDRIGARRLGNALRGLGWVKKRAAKDESGKQAYIWVRDSEPEAGEPNPFQP